jgi:RNA polymerase sigma-70 factor, ECF subfamily
MISFRLNGPTGQMAVTTPIRSLQEHELLDAARAGDEDAFRRLVEPHRAQLHAHCYRMLGSLHDAEDALQETMLRAWRGLPRFEGRSAAGSWLYKIATNACLDAIAKRPKRVLPVDYGPPSAPTTSDPGEPLVESVWIGPYPDETLGVDDGYAAPEARYEQREAVELAFIAALQHLPARQRAVLILREVLGFSAREVSASLETTVASVNSALQRARKAVDERLPERSQQETLRSLGDERIRELVEAYVDAWRRGDVEALRALLAEDAVFSMPPWSMWWRGRDTIALFAHEAKDVCAVSQPVHVRVNGQAGLAYYTLDADTGRFVANALDVITFEGTRIKEITAFIAPELFPHFGLAPEL